MRNRISEQIDVYERLGEETNDDLIKRIRHQLRYSNGVEEGEVEKTVKEIESKLTTPGVFGLKCVWIDTQMLIGRVFSTGRKVKVQTCGVHFSYQHALLDILEKYKNHEILQGDRPLTYCYDGREANRDLLKEFVELLIENRDRRK